MGTVLEASLDRAGAAPAIRGRIANHFITGALVVAVDVLAVIGAGWLAALACSRVNSAVEAGTYTPLWPVSLLFVAAYAVLGLYPGVGLSPVEELRRLVLGATMVCLAGSAFNFLSRDTTFSRGVLLTGWALSATLVPLARSLLKLACASRPWWGVPVLILGAGEAGRRIVASLAAQPELGLKPVAMLDDDWDAEGYAGVPFAGPLAAAPELGRRLGVSHVLLAMPGLQREQLLRVLERMGAAFSHVIVIPDLFGMASLWVSPRDLGGELGLEVRQNLLIPMNRWLKRALDLLVSALVVLASAPLVALAAVWVKLADPGPAFFRQERGGEGDRTIGVWKLRTMFQDSEATFRRYLEAHPAARLEWQRFYKLKNDPRLLPCIGSLLRQTSLDEIPQLWNVIKGEMSLVGPRPFPSYHLEQFDGEFRKLRARVLPGVTGLWQVSARSNGDLQVQQALDTYYIRNWSLWLDLHILARTVRAVLFRQGAY
jgi:Undecaprenyl-phosphate galactose phosphotransferase WbaP